MAVTAQLPKDLVSGGQAQLRKYAVDHLGQRATVMYSSIGQSCRLVVTLYRNRVVDIESEPQERDITRQILAHEEEIAGSGLERIPVAIATYGDFVADLGQPIVLIEELDRVDHEHLKVVVLDVDVGRVDDGLTPVDSTDGAPPDHGIPEGHATDENRSAGQTGC